MHDKAAQRRSLRQARKNLPPAQRRQAEQRVCARLSRFIKRGQRIAAYWAVGSELSPARFIKTATQRGAQVYLPYIEAGKQRLWFTPYRAGTLAERTLARSRKRPDIPQFTGSKIRAHRLHKMLLPLVGIDRQGFRIGQGGGFYDVTLHHCRHRLQPHKIGIGFACQMIEHAHTEAHDIRADCFVSERGTTHFPRTQR